MMRWILKLTGYTLLAAVVALCLYTIPPTIESEVLANAKQALKSHDMGWVLVSIDGRDLTLSGSPPNDDAAAKAVNLLRSTTGVREVATTWAQKTSTDGWDAPPSSIDLATIDHQDGTSSAHLAADAMTEPPITLTLPTQQAPDQELEN